MEKETEGVCVMKKVAVLGAGSWGTALSMVLQENGHEAKLYSIVPEQVEEINAQHTNKKYLPGIQLPEELTASSNLKEVLQDVSVILFVIPTSGIRKLAQEVAELLEEPKLIIHASKGLEQETH